VIDREGRGVTLRYAELLELARRAEVQPPVECPPVAAAIESARYVGVYADGAATFEATFQVRVIGSASPTSEVLVPLGFEGAGGAEALLDGAPATLRVDGAGALTAVLPRVTGERSLVVRFSVPAVRRGAEREIAFRAPAAASARLDLEIPDALDAVADPPLLERKRLPDGAARLTLTCGGARRVALTLRPRDDGRPAAPHVVVEQAAVASISDGAARIDAVLRFEVYRAPLADIILDLPEGYSLVDVRAPDLLRFETVGRRLRVERARPNEGRFEVSVALGRVISPGALLPIRPIGVPGAARISGIVALEPAAGVAARLEAAQGLVELPASRLSEASRASAGQPREQSRGRSAPPLDPRARRTRVFAHAEAAYSLDVRPEPLPVRAAAYTAAVVTLEDREAVLRASVATEVLEGRVFRITLLLPPVLDLADVVVSRPAGEWEKRILEEVGARRLEVDLRRPASRGDDVRVSVTGRSTYPTGASLRSVSAVALPLIEPQGFERVAGILSVAVDSAYRLSAERTSGLEPLDAALVPADLVAHGAPALAFRIVGSPLAASTLIRREPPRIDATVLSTVRVATGRLTLLQEVLLEVTRAPVEGVTLLVPSGAGSRVHVEGPAVKEWAIEPAGALGDRIRIRFQGEQLGQVRVFVDAEGRAEEWTPTGTAQVLVPLARAEDVARDEGSVLVLAGDATEIAPRTADLEAIDASELPVASRVAPAGRLVYAWRSALPTRALSLSLVRRDDEPLLTAAVARAAIAVAVDPQGLARTRARFDLRNARNQSIGVRIPREATLLSVLVDGEGAKPARSRSSRDATAQTILIPLDEARLGREALGIEVVYESAHEPWIDEGGDAYDGTFEAEAPVVVVGEAEVPVLASDLELRLPRGFRYTGFGGTAERTAVGAQAPVLAQWLGARPERLIALCLVAGAATVLCALARILWARLGWGKLSLVLLVLTLLGSCLFWSLITQSRRDRWGGESSATRAPTTGAGTGAPMPKSAPDSAADSMLAAATEQAAPESEGMSREDAPSDFDQMNLRMRKERRPEPAKPKAPPAISGKLEAPEEAAPAADDGDGERASAARVNKRLRVNLGAEEVGLRSLAIGLPEAAYVETFRLPAVGAGTVTVDFTGADGALGRSLRWALLGLLIGLLGARDRSGAWVRFILVAVAATTLGGAALGPAWAGAADGLTAGFIGAGIAFGATRLLDGVARALEGRGGARIGAGATASTGSSGRAHGGALLLLGAASLALLSVDPTHARAEDDAKPAAVEGSVPLAPPPGVRVYVPYDPEHPMRVAPSGEVFVPLGDFERLWERAHGATSRDPAAAKGAAFIAGARFQGKVDATAAVIDATYLVRRPGEGTARVALGLAGAAIESARLGSVAAVLEPAPGGVAALVPAATGDPGTEQSGALVELVVRFRVPVVDRRASFPIAAAPVARARLDLDAPGYELLIPSARGAVRRLDAPGVAGRVEADLGGAAELALVLSAEVRRPGAGAAIEAKAETATTVRMHAGHLEAKVDVLARASGGRIDRLRLTVQATWEPISVEGAGVRSWRIVEEKGERILEVAASEPVESLSVTVRAEAPLAPSGRFSIMGLPVRDVGQERGTLILLQRPEERPVVAKRTGVVQIDAAEAGAAREPANGFALLAAYRFSARPVEVQVDRPPIVGRVGATVDARFGIEERKIRLDLMIRWKPEARPLFEGLVRIPPGFALDAVRAAGSVETLEAANGAAGGRMLRLRFPEGRTDTVEALVRCSRPRAADEAAAQVPFVEVPGVDRSPGTLLVETAREIEAGVLEAAGLDVIDPSRVPPLQQGGGLVPRLAWRTGTAAGAPALRISVRTLAPEVEATTVIATTLHPDLLECDARIILDVRRSGLERITVELPVWVGDGASFAAEGLREVSSIDGASARFSDGRARVYTLAFQRSFQGARAIDLFFERAQATERGAQSPPEIELPSIGVREAASGRTYLLAQLDGRTSARLEEAAVAGAERVSRDDLPRSMKEDLPGGGDFVFAYLGRGAPRVKLRRLALTAGERIEAIVDAADLLTVIDPSGVERTLARYRVQNRSEQFLELRLPEGATLWSAYVADEPAKPVRKPDAGGDRTLIPLPKRAKGELSFDVEVVFERKGGGPLGSFSKVVPAAPAVLNMRVSETFWTVRMPESTRVFSIDGNLDETLEALKERRRLEQAVDELKNLADLMKSGSETEKRNAGMNWTAQYARVEEQRKKAEEVQTRAANIYAFSKEAESDKVRADLNSNESAIFALNRRQSELLGDLQKADQQQQGAAMSNRGDETRRGKKAFDDRLAKQQFSDTNRLAQQELKDLNKATEDLRSGPQSVAGIEIDLPTGAPTPEPVQTIVIGGTVQSDSTESPIEVYRRAAERAPSDQGEGTGGFIDPDAPAQGPAGGGAGLAGRALGRQGQAGPQPGGAAGALGGVQGGRPARPNQQARRDLSNLDEPGRSGRDQDGRSRQGGDKGGVAAGQTGQAFEGGRRSLRLPIPETGRAIHFRKSGGDAELSFRVASVSFPWVESALRLAALALLLLTVRASGAARGSVSAADGVAESTAASQGRSFLAGLAAVALAALGLLALQGLVPSLIAIALLGVAYAAARRWGLKA